MRPSDHDKILRAIRRAGGGMSSLGPTAAKFPLIKKALSAACRELPTDTRLPSIREIAAALGTTVVPVQRAITELKTDGVVYTKNKSGIFIRGGMAPASDSPQAIASATGMRDFTRRIRFLTDSVAPTQRELWSGIAASFMESQDYIEVGLDFRSPQGLHITPPRPDVIEGIDQGVHSSYQEFTYLSLRDFIPAATCGETGIFGGSFVPLYHQTAYLVYNRTAMERKGLPVPRHQDFQGQFAYCRNLRETCANVSSVHPILLAGRVTADIATAIRSGHAIEDTEIPGRFHRVVEFAASFSYRLTSEDQEAQNRFESGDALILLAGSNFLWQCRAKPLPFEWRAYPLFNVDDELVKTPVVAGVLTETRSPMECVRWITHLLSAPVQDTLAAFGYLPHDTARYGQLPSHVEGARLLAEKFPASTALFAASYPDYYLGIYIINAEIWNCIKGAQRAEDALRNIMTYGRAYLSGEPS